jgi:hypothetical protein
MEHVRARKVSAPGMFFVLVICACGLLLNPAKLPNFQYKAWLCSLDQKFHGDDEKTLEPRFWDLAQWHMAIIRPKSQNSNIRHDGILSIWNFMLMINNHFARYQLPGYLLKTKNYVLPISVATRNFLFTNKLTYTVIFLAEIRSKTVECRQLNFRRCFWSNIVQVGRNSIHSWFFVRRFWLIC